MQPKLCKRQTFLLCFLIILFFFKVSHAQKEETQLNKNFDKLHFLMEQPNATELAALAHPNLEYVHSSNTRRDKSGFVEEFTKGQTKLKNIKILDKHITYTGKVATIRYNLVAEDIKTMPAKEMDIIIMQVWIKKRKKWLLLARQAAKIPAEYAKIKM
jgi:hypothetical protein